MGKSTFRGGAHPYEGKELSMDHPIQKIMPKDILVFPMSQHIGAPATPVVAVGDAVKMGQKIGEAALYPPTSSVLCQERSRRWSRGSFRPAVSPFV